MLFGLVCAYRSGKIKGCGATDPDAKGIMGTGISFPNRNLQSPVVISCTTCININKRKVTPRRVHATTVAVEKQ